MSKENLSSEAEMQGQEAECRKMLGYAIYNVAIHSRQSEDSILSQLGITQEEINNAEFIEVSLNSNPLMNGDLKEGDVIVTMPSYPDGFSVYRIVGTDFEVPESSHIFNAGDKLIEATMKTTSIYGNRVEKPVAVESREATDFCRGSFILHPDDNSVLAYSSKYGFYHGSWGEAIWIPDYSRYGPPEKQSYLLIRKAAEMGNDASSDGPISDIQGSAREPLERPGSIERDGSEDLAA